MLGSVSQGLDFMVGRVLVRSAKVLSGKARNGNYGMVECGNVWIGEVGRGTVRNGESWRGLHGKETSG